MNQSLLLISERPEDQAFASEVAKSAGLTLVVSRGAQQGVEFIAKESPIAIFVDVSSEKQFQQFEGQVQESLGLFSDKISANAIHFICSEELEKAAFLVQSPLFGHFIHRAFGDSKASGQHYGRVVAHSIAPRAFGLGGLLAPHAKIQIVRLQNSSQKSDAVEAVRIFAVAAKFQARMATVIASAVDELLMNAIFDAPIDELGRPLYKITSRSNSLKLEGPSAVELHVGFDGTYIGVSAVDLYGSLDKSTLLSHMSKLYRDEEYRVKASVASAGIGLATVSRTGASLYFASESRVRTEVTALYRKSDTFREFKDQFRFISTQFYF